LKYETGTTPPVSRSARRVLRQLATGEDAVSDARATVQEAETALDDTAAAARFVETGGPRRLRRAAERTDDADVRERANAVLEALDRLGQVTGWSRTQESDRGEVVPRVADEPTVTTPSHEKDYTT
jgi:hypothetical protein